MCSCTYTNYVIVIAIATLTMTKPISGDIVVCCHHLIFVSRWPKMIVKSNLFKNTFGPIALNGNFWTYLLRIFLLIEFRWNIQMSTAIIVRYRIDCFMENWLSWFEIENSTEQYLMLHSESSCIVAKSWGTSPSSYMWILNWVCSKKNYWIFCNVSSFIWKCTIVQDLIWIFILDFHSYWL